MSHRDRVGEVWEGFDLDKKGGPNWGWLGLHVVVASEEEPKFPGRTRHTTVSLERAGAVRFAQELTDRGEEWGNSTSWKRFL